MMKTQKLILGIGIVAALFTACNPKEEQGTQLNNSGRQLTALRENLLADAMQETTIDAATGGTITAPQGSQFIFAPNAFQDESGNVLTGNINIEYAEFYKRSDMVLMNKPTTGQMPNGDKTYLITGGEFYMKATQNSCNCDVQIAIPYEIRSTPNPDITAFDTSLIGFRGEVVDNQLTWFQMDGAQATGTGLVPVGVRDGSSGYFYSVFSSENGWTNLDRFSGDPRPKTTLEVSVPDGYTDENASIFISIDGDDHGIALLDRFENGVFSEHYGQLPIGLEAHLIFVSVDDDDTINYQIKAITVTAGQQEHIDNVTVVSQSDMQTEIDALP